MLRLSIVLLFVSGSTLAQATEMLNNPCQSPLELENNWAKTRYVTPSDKRIPEFTTMLIMLNNAPLACLNSAEYQIIEAMIKGSMAKLQSRFKAIKQIKQIKRHLEKAIRRKPSAMNGLGWTLLGLLYDKSPGWPFSLGDDEKAEQAYLNGLKYNPDGMDANYYYGDFLLRKGRLEEARKFLYKASQADLRSGHEIADQGRMGDIRRSFAKLARK